MQPCFILESPWKRVLWVLENPGIWSLQVLESLGKQFLLSVRTLCDERVCVSVCDHISETTRSNFTRFSAHVTCGHSSVLVCRHCNTFVIWFYGWRHEPYGDVMLCSSLAQVCVQPYTTPCCMVLVASFPRRWRVPRQDKTRHVLCARVPDVTFRRFLPLVSDTLDQSRCN